MDMYSELNLEQLEAVRSVEGPFLILAGAGTGKTRVVTCRIAHLIKTGVPPEKILGLTFTNKAAAEMRERVQLQTQSNVLICTFHSLGAKILRESIHHLGYRRDFVIYDEADIEKVLKSCLDQPFTKQEFKSIREKISSVKNQMVMPKPSRDGGLVDKAFPEIYKRYQETLWQYNALDFDDLLYLTACLFSRYPEVLQIYQNRWTFLLVDEYQDTNETQYNLLKSMTAVTNNLFVVGDPDQSIYSWRGANIRNILNFEKDYPAAKIVRLEQNYRSHTHILQASNAVVCRNTSRYEKALWSALGPGEKIKRFSGDTERDEAEFVAAQIAMHGQDHGISHNDMAVFYRTNAQSRALEDCFFKKQIPYIIIGGISFYQRKEIKDVLAFLRMAHSGSDFISFSRSINIPKRGIGEATVEKIRDAAALEGCSILDYCRCLISLKSLKNPLRITAKQKESLGDYVRIIDHLSEMKKTNSIKDLVEAVIEQTGYLHCLAAEDKDSLEDRKENLSALMAKAAEWEEASLDPTLEAFLEELSLRGNADEADSKDRVSLMSIHNSKGLEFSVVFIVGLEEELFPHINASRESEEGLEEERRLCYVGMTRAKKYLYMCDVAVRYIWGVSRTQRPSRFLKEIPSEHIEYIKRRFTSHKSLPETGASFKKRALSDSAPKAEKIILSVEDTVFHKEFGIGTIKEIYETSLGMTYKVSFADGKTRSLVAKLAPLHKL